ncbi:hypothetical protein GALMADRAFT_139192 [Galerina marginata CBS 339.88]|uniref:Hemerythrin-like domain-containing protein n=1 Tax=Galerina marginata (strain CBS 339.88) TaxID=685588 RepID=A0A067TDW4_GALM3|nr:hypothetical protein GALMADRAFT_139192 [Galerina marginata CBS 339.88]
MALLTFEPDGPYPLISISNTSFDFHNTSNIAQWFSTELSLTHNVILRALNAIWLNAFLVLPADEGDFMGFGLACLSMIRSHHETQEKVVFPILQEKIDMRMNVVQHIEFDELLKDLETYLRKVQNKQEPYDSGRLLELRAALGSRLVQHLHDEVDTVNPKYLYAFSKQELMNLVHAIDEHKKNFRDSATLLPFIVTNHHKEDAPDWPIVPASLKWLTNHVGFQLHRHYWKFSPYTATGDVQTYPPHSEPSHAFHFTRHNS